MDSVKIKIDTPFVVIKAVNDLPQFFCFGVNVDISGSGFMLVLFLVLKKYIISSDRQQKMTVYCELLLLLCPKHL